VLLYTPNSSHNTYFRRGVFDVRAKSLALLIFLCIALLSIAMANPAELTTDCDQARELARQAYIFAYPMLEHYKTMSVQAIKLGLFNQFYHSRMLRGPDYKDVVRPNNDNIYSALWLDLRSEPFVISVPAIEDRYYSFQMIDMYTHNFAYVGTRSTGTGAKTFMICGPFWEGVTPSGVDYVFESEGVFVLCLIRITVDEQASGDLEKVLNLQKEHKLQPLSHYLGVQPPSATLSSVFPVYDQSKARSVEFISYFNFLLDHLKIHPSERELIAEFGQIGIAPGWVFNSDSMDETVLEAIKEGIGEAIDIIENPGETVGISKNGWNLTKRIFGNREEMQGKYLVRASAAYLGLYGNSLEEAYCPNSLVDGDGDTYDGSKFDYVLSFKSDELPPIEDKGFWSITMYNEDQFMVANPLNRYSIGNRANMVYGEDGSLVIYIQHESPGTERESNWLPAPDGVFSVSMRIYLPSPIALDPLYCPPPVVKAGKVSN